MGLSKTELFREDQVATADIFKALAHPARVAILQHLANTNGCVCGGLVDELGLAQATVSQHLRELKRAGLIRGTVSGKSICYCIHPEGWKKAAELMEQLQLHVQRNPACC